MTTKPKTIDELRKSLPERERRYVTAEDGEIELRAAEGEAPKIGMTIPFGKRSHDLGGFVEVIAPGAFTRTIKNGASAKRGDIVALWNHDPNWVLGRQANRTLALVEDEHRMQGEVTLDAEDAMHRHFARRVERRDVTGSSFAFRVTKQGQSWDMDGDTMVRTLTEVQLDDVSPVTYPAYPDSSSQKRSLVDVAAVKLGLDVSALLELVAGAEGGKVAQDAAQALRSWVAKLAGMIPAAPEPEIDWAAKLKLRERILRG